MVSERTGLQKVHKGYFLGWLRIFLDPMLLKRPQGRYNRCVGRFLKHSLQMLVSERVFPPISMSLCGLVKKVNIKKGPFLSWIKKGPVWLLWGHLYSIKRGKLFAFACFYKSFSLSSNNFNMHFQKFENATQYNLITRFYFENFSLYFSSASIVNAIVSVDN